MMRAFIQTLEEKPWQHKSELTTLVEIIVKIFQPKNKMKYFDPPQKNQGINPGPKIRNFEIAPPK